MNFEKLFRESIALMEPYSPISPPNIIAKELNLPENQLIKLDANENPYGVAPFVLEAISKSNHYHIYPDPAQINLRKKISDYIKINPDQIVVGTGADELIDLCCRLLLNPQDKVLSFIPTFAYYSHPVLLNNASYYTVEREIDYSISIDKIKLLDLTNVKIVFLCSPNNPSGNLLEAEILDYFLQKDLIVIVDEAYCEFAEKSYVALTTKYENLVILRTFSKCFGLAGLRVGYAVTSLLISKALMKIKPPFSVNNAAEIALTACLDHFEYFQNQVQKIIQTREWTYNQLKQIPQLKAFQSHSNFILCKFLINGQAQQIYQKLRQHGILVRYFNTLLLNNCLRLSVGTKKQMEFLIKILREII